MKIEKSLVRADIYNAVGAELVLSLAESSKLTDAVLEEMVNALENESELKLSGFGTFTVYKKQARVGRNPKTGKAASISPRAVLSFNPSNMLKESLNQAMNLSAEEIL